MRTTVLNYFHTFHPEAQAELDRLVKEDARLALEQARQAETPLEERPKQRMNEKARDFDAERSELKAAIEEQREVIASGVVRLVVKGLNRGEYRRLLSAHAPREGDPLDEQLGYNADTFGDAFIQACIVKTLAHEVNGGGPVENRWDEWADEMTNGQWDEIFRACLRLTNDPNPSLPQ